MKRITIGRGRECQIRVSDNSDQVSRKQCVITVTPLGKMRIYDLSSNGTFVNGEKVPVPEGRSVKRTDKVNFAHVTDFDWNQLRDPYRMVKISLGVLLAAAIVAAVLFFVFAGRFTAKEKAAAPTEQTVAADSLQSQKADTVNTVAPAEPAKAPAPRRKAPARKVKPQIKKDREQPVKFEPEPIKSSPGAGISHEELREKDWAPG